MKSSSVIACVFSLSIISLFLFTGCPYSSGVPLSPPSETVDEGFYGRWLLDSGDENPDYYEIGKIDGTTFSLEKYTYDSEGEIYSRDNSYAAWFTTIGEIRFMNVEDVEDRGTYYFYKLEMPSAESFILFEVTDNIDEEFTDSSDMYEFFASYKNLSFFYNSDEETYLRNSRKKGGAKKD